MFQTRTSLVFLICALLSITGVCQAGSLDSRSCNPGINACCHPPQYACGPKTCCTPPPKPPKCSGKDINGFCCPKGHVVGGSCSCGAQGKPSCDTRCQPPGQFQPPNLLDCCFPGLGLDKSNTCQPCGSLGFPGMRSCNGVCNKGSKFVDGRCFHTDAIASPTLVIMCKVQGYPKDGDTNLVLNLFTGQGSGTNNLFDYFTEMSYGRFDMSGTTVIGWVQSTVPFSSDRITFINGCIDAAGKAYPGYAFSKFASIISVLNTGPIGSGNWGLNQNQLTLNGVTKTYGLVSVDTFGMFTNFLSHEMGHNLGLEHSRDDRNDQCGGGPGEYCDDWDEMSAQHNYFGQNQYGNQANSLVAGHRIKLGWIVPSEIYDAGPGSIASFYIAAVNRPEVTGFDRVIRIKDSAGAVFTVELMTKTGWDSQIPESAVLIHQLDSNDTPTIITAGGGDFGWVPKGKTQATYATSTFRVSVYSIDTAKGIAGIVVYVN